MAETRSDDARPVAEHQDPATLDVWSRLGSPTSLAEGSLDRRRILQIILTMVPHAEHAGVTLLRRGRRPRTAVASDEMPLRVDRLQYEHGEGPCLEASVDPQAIVSGDLTTDPRWPRFAAACVRSTPIRSMLSVQLPLADGDRGALNLYASTPHAFDAADISTTTTSAVFVALVIGHELHEQDVAHLTTALDSNRTISRAVGILMAKRRLTYEDAFRVLQHASSDSNRKLRDLAEAVELEGDLPDAGSRSSGA